MTNRAEMTEVLFILPLPSLTGPIRLGLLTVYRCDLRENLHNAETIGAEELPDYAKLRTPTSESGAW
ncbi:hypothetical protein Pth03_49470 [Planotetraspora thailandica]|uniref:Uncharacterized protein n=1 Tax=Planotetraspora thailandica TaxID=487172 RepID=A0A8J3V4E8_9ACTN|nr:hypothetical protein Pth03_49470 [Planotetraspora thailandica]